MGLKTRYTKRVFDGSQFANPLDYEGVRHALGHGWYQKMESMLALVEFVEGWTDYPTDEDEGVYREFLLGQGDTRWAQQFPQYSEQILSSRIKDACNIGMFYMTDDNHNHGLRPRAYIYSPSVANIVEEIYADYHKAKRDGTLEVTHTREGYTSGIVHEDVEWGEIPTKEEAIDLLGPFFRHKAHNFLHFISTVDGVIEHEGQEFYINYLQPLLGWGKNSIVNYATLGSKIGFMRCVDHDKWPKSYIFNPAWRPLFEELANAPYKIKKRKNQNYKYRHKPKKPGPCDELIIRVEEEDGDFTGAVFPSSLLPEEVDLTTAVGVLEEAGLPLLRWARELEKWTDMEAGEAREFHFSGKSGCFGRKRKWLRRSGMILPTNSIFSRSKSNHGRGYIYNPRVLEALLSTL